MRFVTGLLLAFLLVVQAELWFGKGGVPRAVSLRSHLQEQVERNAQLRARNDLVVAEVRDLQEGLDTAEEIARSELGMVKPDEIFVQVSRPR